MSNLLALPFRKSYTIQIKPAAREYILKSPIHPHPDAYKADLTRWEALRAEGTGGVVHVDRVDATLLYALSSIFFHVTMSDIVFRIM